MSEAGEHEENAKEGARAHKREEIPVVSSSNAVIDPYTMMVLCFYAAVTYSAMMTSWRPPDVACLTVLCGNVHGAIQRPGRLNCSPLCGRWPQAEGVIGIFWER